MRCDEKSKAPQCVCIKRPLVKGVTDKEAAALSPCTIPLMRAARKDWPTSHSQMIVIRSKFFAGNGMSPVRPCCPPCCLDNFDLPWPISAASGVRQAEAQTVPRMAWIEGHTLHAYFFWRQLTECSLANCNAILCNCNGLPFHGIVLTNKSKRFEVKLVQPSTYSLVAR